jgi:hypothetical protein
MLDQMLTSLLILQAETQTYGLEMLSSQASNHITWSHEKTTCKGGFFVAGDEGFEPPNAGTRNLSLTTWPIPNGLCNSVWYR